MNTDIRFERFQPCLKAYKIVSHLFTYHTYEIYSLPRTDRHTDTHKLSFNLLLPKCYDGNKQPKRPFSLEKLTNFTRKLSNFGTFFRLKMF